MRQMVEASPGQVKLLVSSEIDGDMLEKNDLLLVSYNTWKNLAEAKTEWLKDIPSTLIIKP